MLRLHGLGLTELTEGTVYPALSRLESRGLLGSRLVPSASGPARKYYELTPAGLEELVRGVSAWTSLAETVHSVLSPASFPATSPRS